MTLFTDIRINNSDFNAQVNVRIEYHFYKQAANNLALDSDIDYIGYTELELRSFEIMSIDILMIGHGFPIGISDLIATIGDYLSDSDNLLSLIKTEI